MVLAYVYVDDNAPKLTPQVGKLDNSLNHNAYCSFMHHIKNKRHKI